MIRKLVDVFKGKVDDYIILEGPRVFDRVPHIAVQKHEIELALGNHIVMLGRFTGNKRWFITWGKVL